jgi:hypothetical protein
MVGSFVSAQDTYVESMQRLREEQQQSKKEIIGAINSFNDAFRDTFRLIDDEFSRLIYSQAAMVGIVFAIMFLVYAKTTARYKRDIQILLAAHSKHVDNLITTRLDEFVARLESRMKEDKSTSLSSFDVGFDELAEDVFRGQEKISRKEEIPSREVSKPVTPARRFEEIKARVTAIEEAKIDEDGRVKILKSPTSRLNRFKKRVRSGLKRLLGRSKEKKQVKEFKR